MMISLVFCGDLKYCPYLRRYTERLDALNADYQVLFWNRGGQSLKLPDNYYYYDYPSEESASMSKKLIDFLKFRKWLLKFFKNNHTDGIILLSTLTGILLYPGIKKYPYIFDIRDYSFEKISVFKNIEKSVIEKSKFTCISSKGFKAFLPEYPYIIAHNFNRKDINQKYEFKHKKLPIKIVWNGTVRFFDYQKKYIQALKNDCRFLLVYHGDGTDLQLYKNFCEENNIKNVIFTGAYDNKDKENLLSDAGILNNCYGGRNGDELRYAISNRFYDGLIYHIPQLVEPDGYKAEITNNIGVGISLEPGPDFADRLYEYYMNIDKEIFDKSCGSSLTKILEEDNKYILNIDNFISEISK